MDFSANGRRLSLGDISDNDYNLSKNHQRNYQPTDSTGTGPSTPIVDDLGSTTTLVAVANLIDFDSDSSKAAMTQSPTITLSFTPDVSGVLNSTMLSERQHSSDKDKSSLMPSNDSGISTNGRCSAEIMSEDGEESYVGTANGHLSGTSLLDSPVEFIRPHSVNNMGPTPVGRGSGRMSSNAFASQLYNNHIRQNVSSNYSGSRRSSFNSDDMNMSVSDQEVHSEISEISTQVQKIHQKLTFLEENHLNSDDKFIRIKQENAVLQERIHILEEQHQQREERWKEKLEDERNRHKEAIQRVEREKTLETESFTYKYQLVEREMSDMRKDKEKLLANIEKLKSQNAQLEERVDDLKSKLGDLASDHEDTNGQYYRYKDKAEAELRTKAETIEELKHELEMARQMHRAPPRRLSSVTDRAAELEEEVSRLRIEQRRLEDCNEELQAQIIATSVAEGRSLLMHPCPGSSLADELDSMSKDQLMETLKEQEVVNQKLRIYVDGILLRILEMYPAILEIQPGDKNFSKPP